MIEVSAHATGEMVGSSEQSAPVGVSAAGYCIPNEAVEVA